MLILWEGEEDFLEEEKSAYGRGKRIHWKFVVILWEGKEDSLEEVKTT